MPQVSPPRLYAYDRFSSATTPTFPPLIPLPRLLRLPVYSLVHRSRVESAREASFSALTRCCSWLGRGTSDAVACPDPGCDHESTDCGTDQHTSRSESADAALHRRRTRAPVETRAYVTWLSGMKHALLAGGMCAHFYGRRDWLAMRVVIYDKRDIISGKTQSLYAYILSEHPESICFLDRRAWFCGVLCYHHLNKSISVQVSMRRSDVFISKIIRLRCLQTDSNGFFKVSGTIFKNPLKIVSSWQC